MSAGRKMGPIERELREAARACEGRHVQRNYQFWGGLATWCLQGDGVLRLLCSCAESLGVSIYSEAAWSEAIEAAEALGL